MMKCCLSAILLVIYVLWGNAQTLPDTVYTQADEMPYFHGCQVFAADPEQHRRCSDERLVAYIARHLSYPEKAREQQVEGTVYVQFIVDETGAVVQPRLLMDIGAGCGEAALALVRQMPRWEPAKLGGKPVAVKMNLPIRFQLKSEQASPAASCTLGWGPHTGDRIPLAAVRGLARERLIVRDAFGNELYITEIRLVYERNGKRRELKCAPLQCPQLQTFLKKLRKPGTLRVVGVVQQGTNFFEIEKVWRLD